jgi:hypothetical protein
MLRRQAEPDMARFDGEWEEELSFLYSYVGAGQIE